MREVVSSIGAAIGTNNADAVGVQVDAIDAHGVFTFEETHGDAMRAPRRNPSEAPGKSERALLLAGSQLTCAQANDLVAARLRPAGGRVTLATSEGRRREYAVGDWIVLFKNGKWIGVNNKGTTWIASVSQALNDDGRVITINPQGMLPFAQLVKIGVSIYVVLTAIGMRVHLYAKVFLMIR